MQRRNLSEFLSAARRSGPPARRENLIDSGSPLVYTRDRGLEVAT